MQLSSASSAGRRNGTSATNLLAAKAGAGYRSIFVGRLDDTGQDGISVVRDTVQVVKNYGFKSEVLAASIRYPLHVMQSALAGSHVVTIPPLE